MQQKKIVFSLLPLLLLLKIKLKRKAPPHQDPSGAAAEEDPSETASVAGVSDDHVEDQEEKDLKAKVIVEIGFGIRSVSVLEDDYMSQHRLASQCGYFVDPTIWYDEEYQRLLRKTVKDKMLPHEVFDAIINFLIFESSPGQRNIRFGDSCCSILTENIKYLSDMEIKTLVGQFFSLSLQDSNFWFGILGLFLKTTEYPS